VTLAGSYFRSGSIDTAKVNITYGPNGLEYEATQCNLTKTTNGGIDAEMECLTAPGYGKDHSWIVSINTIESAMYSCEINGVCSSYTAPEITSISAPSLLATAGGEYVTLTGTNFGPSAAADAMFASYGVSGATDSSTSLKDTLYNSSDCEVVTAHTVVRCNTVPGVGTNLQWSLTVGEQASDEFTSTLTSYEPPVITSIVVDVGNTNLTTEGSDFVTITGTSFGPISSRNLVTAAYQNPILETLGGSVLKALSCEVSTIDTIMTCLTAVGVGHDQAWNVTVGGQTSDFSSDTTSYAVPRIESRVDGSVRDGVSFIVDNYLEMVSPSHISTDGTTAVTLTGTNFGPESPYENTIYVHYQSATLDTESFGYAGVAHTASDCSVADGGEHWQIICLLTDVGVGTGMQFYVNVGNQTSPPSTLYIDYNIPYISGLSTSSGTISTTGGDVVTITGEDFGPSQTPGVDRYLHVVYGLEPDVAATFGPNQLVRKTLTATSCNVTVDHTEIECLSDEGIGEDLEFTAVVGNQTSNSSKIARISYSAPSVSYVTGGSGVDINNLLTVGNEEIIFTGENFGPLSTSGCSATGDCNGVEASYGSELNSYLGADAKFCNVTVEHSEITCITDVGVGAELNSRATVGGQTGDYSTFNISYHRPIVTSIFPVSGTSLGGTRVTISGTYFGIDVNTVDVILNGTAATVKEVTDNAIIAVLNVSSPGIQYIVVSVGGQLSSSLYKNMTKYYAYTPISMTPDAAPYRGGTTLKLAGIALYASDFIGCRIGYQNYEGQSDDANGGYIDLGQGTFDEDDSTLVFTLPEVSLSTTWFGEAVPIWMSLNNVSWSILRDSTFTVYDKPSLTSLSPQSGPISGGTIVTVTGTGFVDTGYIVGRIRSHSSSLSTYNRTLINTTDLQYESLTNLCTFVSTVKVTCPMNVTTSTEVIEITMTMDDPLYNDEIQFSGLNGPEYYYYNEPNLYPGDTQASGTAASTYVTVRASLTLDGISMRDIGRDAIDIFETDALTYCTAAYAACNNIEVEQIRNGEYKTEMSTTTGVTTSNYDEYLDFFGGSNVTMVLTFGFSTSATTSDAWPSLSDFLTTSDIQGFGDIWASITAATGSDGTVPTSLEESPVIYPQVGPTITVCPYYCDTAPATCADSTDSNFIGFCFNDQEGTRITIAGIGIVPTPDALRIKVGDYVYESDAYNNATVSIQSDGDTLITFVVPDLDVGTRALEIALNGQDFTQHTVAYTHMELSNLYQTYSIADSVYGPEHSTVGLQMIGDQFVYAPYSSSTQRRGSHTIQLVLAGINNLIEVDHGNLVDTSCSDYFCSLTAYYCDSSGADSNLDALDFTTCNPDIFYIAFPQTESSDGTSYAGVWDLQFSINDGASYGQAVGNVHNYTIYSTPAVDVMSPRSGPLSGGTTLGVTGTYFDTGYVDMTVGTQALEDCTLLSLTKVRCKTTEYTTSLEVLTPTLTIDTEDVISQLYSSINDTFMYYDPFYLDTVTPSYGLSTGSTLMSISGRGLEVLDDYPEFFEPATCDVGNITVPLYTSRSQSMYELDVSNQAASNNSLGKVTVALSIDTASLISSGDMNVNCSDIRVYYETAQAQTEAGAEGDECDAHADCSPSSPLCYRAYTDAAYGTCQSCSYCATCGDGVDGTCGTCDTSTYPTSSSTCWPAYSWARNSKNSLGRFLGHYIEGCGDSDSTLWVQFDSVSRNTTSALPTDATIDDGDKLYVVLGGDVSKSVLNAHDFWTATASRQDDVFMLHDDFNTRDVSKWTYVGLSFGAGGSVGIGGSFFNPSDSATSVYDLPGASWEQDILGPQCGVGDGHLKITGLNNASRFMHTNAPISSRAFAFKSTITLTAASECVPVKFMVGPLDATLGDAPLVLSYCANVDMKCINDKCVSCDRTSSPLSVDLTVSVDWGRSGNVTFIDDVCSDLTLRVDEFTSEYTSQYPKYLFIGTGPSGLSENGAPSTSVHVDEFKMWNYANVTVDDPSSVSSSITSNKLITCNTPDFGEMDGMYNVSFSLNGQQYTTLQDSTQTFTIGSPFISRVSIPSSLSDQDDFSIYETSGVYTGAMGGGEILEIGGFGLPDTALGAKVRFTNNRGSKYAEGSVGVNGLNVTTTIPSFYYESSASNTLETTIEVSFNDQQYLSVDGPRYSTYDGELALKTPETCQAIHEDFDYINNAGSMDTTNDDFNAFGSHHSYWHNITGGRTDDACFFSTLTGTSSYKYQRLIFDSNSTVRLMESEPVDASSMDNSSFISFNMTWLRNDDRCISRSFDSDSVSSPVFIEASTDGSTWSPIAAFGEGLSGDDNGIRWETDTGVVSLQAGSDLSDRAYNISMGSLMDLAAPNLRIRWIQEVDELGGDPWAIDSISFVLTPTVQSAMTIADMQPRSALLTGGTIVHLSGTFPKPTGPLTCRFKYGGSMTVDSPSESFRQWNDDGVSSMVTTWHNESYVSCEVPPYYADVSDTTRCESSSKRLCTDCCVLTLSLESCGVPLAYAEVDTYPDGTTSTTFQYKLLEHEFMLYQQIAVTTLFPLTGSLSSEGTLTQLSESTSFATIFFSPDIRIRFTVEATDDSSSDQVFEFGGSVNTGVGLLVGFPQVGSSYGEVGFPFGCDANSYRFQALYLWDEVSDLYDTAIEIQGLSDTDLETRCIAQGYYDSISGKDCTAIDADDVEYVGLVDRIQFKVKTAPTANFRGMRIGIDAKIDDSSADLYEVMNEQTLFYSSVESTTTTDGYQVLSIDAFDNFGTATEVGWSGETTTFEDDVWVTLALDYPFELNENFHILMELSEDGSSEGGVDTQTTSDSFPSLYYQHTYDRRTLRWYTESDPGSPYPFAGAIPTAVPYDNMTFGQRVPMVQFCIFPDACPQQALVEVTSSTNSYVASSARRRTSEKSRLEAEEKEMDKKARQNERREAAMLRRTTAIGDDSNAWSAATVEVALNGIDFHEVYSDMMIYDETEMYFDPSELAPLIGPNTGDTEITFTLPENFPFFDPAEFYDYQLGFTETTPTDEIIIRYTLHDGLGGFDEYQEFSVGLVDSATPTFIYTYTPPLQAGTYSISLSVNGRNYWPGDGYTPSSNCTYENSIGRVLSGDCVTSEDECAGFYDESSFVTAFSECQACCITDTEFYVYTDFDISRVDEGGNMEGYSSGYIPDLEGDGELETWEVSIDIGDTTYVDADRVCCFYLAPRDAQTAEVDVSFTDDEDDYADRILDLPPVDDTTFPRQTPDESIWNICGEPYATLTSASIVTCAAPALPVWTSIDEDWKLRVTVNAQNHHGVVSASTAWANLDGLNYNSLPCPEGYYSESYDQVCQPCAKGSYDDRTEVTLTDLKECTVCGEGYYQDTIAQTSCTACPRGPDELDSDFYSTTMDLDGNVVEGQISVDACMCASGYWRDPDMADCDTDGLCCNTCPTPGGKCLGGISSQIPQAAKSGNGGTAQTAVYYDYDTGNTSDTYYHMMPYAKKGYYRIEGPTEGAIGECTPEPETDDDGTDSDPGACEGGVYDVLDEVQFDNVCAPGYRQSFMCASCERGYYKSSNTCIVCPTKNPVVMGFLFLCLIGFLSLFAKYARHLNGLASPRVFYNFGLVTSSFMYFDIAWPVEIVKFLEIIDKYIAIDINVLHSECEIPDLSFIEVTAMTLATPFILGEMFALLYVAEVFVRKFQTENRMEATDTAADRTRTIMRGMANMGTELVGEVYRQLILNLFLSFFGPRGLIWSLLFLLLGWVLVPLYIIFSMLLVRILPRCSLPPVRSVIDSRLASIEESFGRLFEFTMWFATYSLGGIPAILVAFPLYMIFVVYIFITGFIELGAADDHLGAGATQPKYKTYMSTLLLITDNFFLRWFIVSPFSLFLIPIDLIVTTITYFFKIGSYIAKPPAPVTIGEWPEHAGRASAMVWLPDKFWDSAGTPGSFLSRIVHWIAGHFALFFFAPVAGMMFAIGKIVAAIVWVNTPGNGRRLDRPVTGFMAWRRKAIEDYKNVHGEPDAIAFGYKDGNLETLLASGRSIPWGYIRVNVNQSLASRFYRAVMSTGQRMGKKDEVRQIVSIDYTRPTEPERIHIEEPLVDFAFRSQPYQYMSRREIDLVVEKLFKKERQEITIQDVIDTLKKTTGDFYIRRDRKKEVIEKLELQLAEDLDDDRESVYERGSVSDSRLSTIGAYANNGGGSEADASSTGKRVIGRKSSYSRRSAAQGGYGAPAGVITDEEAPATEMVQMEAVKVKVPIGAEPGTMVEFTLPDGRAVKILIPQGSKPGQVIKVNVPKAQSPVPVKDDVSEMSVSLPNSPTGAANIRNSTASFERDMFQSESSFDSEGIQLTDMKRNSKIDFNQRKSHRSIISGKKRIFKNGKRSNRAQESALKDRALDMLGLLKGNWTYGSGRVTVDNPTELTVLSGNMFKGHFDWGAIRGAAFRQLCCLCYRDARPTCHLLLGTGQYVGIPLEVRLAFLAVLMLLTSTYPFLFVAVLGVTIVGQIGLIPSFTFMTKTKALRSEVVVRVHDTNSIAGNALAGASIAQKKRVAMTSKQHKRALYNWHRAYFKARVLQAVVQKYGAKATSSDREMKFKNPTMGSEDAMVQRARALGLFDTYQGDTQMLKTKMSAMESASSFGDESSKGDEKSKKGGAKNKYEAGIDPRDELFEAWLARSGITVFAKRKGRETAHMSENLAFRLKNIIWDSAVSFDVDIRKQAFMLSASGHANENRTAKTQGLHENEESKFAQQFQDSAVTVRFAHRTSATTKTQELVAMIHFSDPETASAWKRAIELELGNPDSQIKGYAVQWRYSLLMHFFYFTTTTIFYLILLPAVLGVTIAMFVWRHLWISWYNTVRRLKQRYEKISFATLQRRQQGKGKTGRDMIHDAMDRPTFQSSWLRDLDSVDDRVAIQKAAQDGSRSGSTFFVENALQHSLTTYITTFPERNADLKLYRNTVSQLGDFAENHEPIDANEYNPRRIANKYVNAFVMLLSFSHVTLSLTVLELVDCSLQPGLPYETLDVDPSIRCGSDEYHDLLRIFYVFAPAYVIGIPCVIMALIYTQVILPGLRNEAEAKIRYGYFYAKYNPDTWWWEVSFMARKLAVPALKMFTDSLVVLVQITGAFLLFLVFALAHNLAKPFIEEGCNLCDTLALSAHVFVMFAGAMYQTGRLQAALASSYAYLFIVVNTGVGLYLFNYAATEVRQSLPIIGMVLSSEFWLQKAWPFVFATVRYRLFGGKHKQKFVEASETFFDFFYAHDEDDYRANMAHRLRRQPLLSDVGRAKAKQWIRDYSSTMRDGLLYNRYLNNCKAEINRSVFVYMVTSPRYVHTNQFEYSKYDKWLSSFGTSIRIMRKHLTADTRLLRHYKIGRSIAGRDAYSTLVTLGSVDVEKLLEPFVPQSGTSARKTHDTEYRPYVDIDGSGNFYLCFINRVTSMSSISVSLCPTKAPPHLIIDPYSGKQRLLELPDPRESLIVGVQSLRVYSRVAIKDHDGEMWPGEITRAQPDGMFRVRDPIHGDYAFPVGRGDLSRIGPPIDHAVGYVWHSFCEEEDAKEYSEMRREDLEVYVHSAEAIASEKIPCKTQIEWLQSRLVLTPAAVGGKDSSSWAAAGYADGTCDVWSSLNGAKMFTLQHGDPVTTVWIAASGNICLTMSSNYLCFWDIPRDRDLGQPARLPNRDPFTSRFFQAESLSLELFEPEEREFSEFTLPEELQESVVLQVGNASAISDQTSVWVVAVNDNDVLLYGVSQRHGFIKAQTWPQPENDPVISAEICGQKRSKKDLVGTAVVAAAKSESDSKKKQKGKLAAKSLAAQSAAATVVAKEAPTQIIVLTTQSGLFFTVHCGGFPVDNEFHASKKEALRKSQYHRDNQKTAKQVEEEEENAMDSGAGLTATTKFKSKKADNAIWTHGGTVLQKILPEREREHRMTAVDKIESQIQALWREHHADARFRNGDHPERSSNTSDRLEDEIKLLRRRLIDMDMGIMRDRYTAAIELMVKKKEYLDKHDVDTKIVDSYVCGETMRAVLLIQEDPVNRRNASSRWYMRLVLLRRDPRVSARDVAPRHLFQKVEDSCDLTESWPRTDPAFFDNAAVAFLARSLGREVNGYEGSFSYLSSKIFFETTLDIAFDHMVEEKRNARLARVQSDIFGASSHRLLVEMSASSAAFDSDADNRGSEAFNAGEDGVKIITFKLRAPEHGLELENIGTFLHIANNVDDDGVTSVLQVEIGDRIVAANGDTTFGFMDAHAALGALAGMLRVGPLVLEMERPGEGLYQVSMNDGPLLGLSMRSADGLLVVHKVTKASPAHFGGMRKGDRIVSANDDGTFAMKTVAEANEALLAVLSDPPHHVVLKILRAPRPKGGDEDDDDDNDDQDDEQHDLGKLFNAKASLQFKLNDQPDEKVKMRIPKGAVAGDIVEMNVNGRKVQIEVPKGAKPGKTMEVVVPRVRTAADEAHDAYLAAKAVTDEKQAEKEAQEAKEAAEKAAADAEKEKEAKAAESDSGLLSGFTNMFGGDSNATSDSGTTAGGGGFTSMFGGSKPSGPIVAEGLEEGDEKEIVKVRVPPNVKSGDTVEFALPGDRSAKVLIPGGVNSGDVIKVQVAKKVKPSVPKVEETPPPPTPVVDKPEVVPVPPAPKEEPKVAESPSPSTYDVTFGGGKLGISLSDVEGLMPLVDDNTNDDQKLPTVGHYLVAVAGRSLAGESDPYNIAIELISTSSRPLILTFSKDGSNKPIAAPPAVPPPTTSSVDSSPAKAPEPVVDEKASVASAPVPADEQVVETSPAPVPDVVSPPPPAAAEEPPAAGGWGTTATSGSTGPTEITKSKDDAGNALLGMFGMEVREEKEVKPDPAAAPEDSSMFGGFGFFDEDKNKKPTTDEAAPPASETSTPKPDGGFFGGFGF